MRPDGFESGYWSGPACDEYMKLYARPSPSAIRQDGSACTGACRKSSWTTLPAIHPSGRKNMLIHKPSVRGSAQPPAILVDPVRRGVEGLMLKALLRRLALSLLVIWLVTVLVFVSTEVLPATRCR
jgi:hypothetical protein